MLESLSMLETSARVFFMNFAKTLSSFFHHDDIISPCFHRAPPVAASEYMLNCNSEFSKLVRSEACNCINATQ